MIFIGGVIFLHVSVISNFLSHNFSKPTDVIVCQGTVNSVQEVLRGEGRLLVYCTLHIIDPSSGNSRTINIDRRDCSKYRRGDLMKFVLQTSKTIDSHITKVESFEKVGNGEKIRIEKTALGKYELCYRADGI